MRIHTDKPDAVEAAIFKAAPQGVYATTTRHSSRSRGAGLELTVEADERKGRRLKNSGQYGAGGDYAATWDEWGAIFAAIFAADDNATCRAYENAAHFHWATGGRFENGGADHPHDMHRWEHQGSAVTGTYHVSTCKGSKKFGPCYAMRRTMAYGHDFAEINH